MRHIKAALHVHSDWSYDGHWRLTAIARMFGALGYDAVLMSEHDTRFAPDRFDAYRQACYDASTSRCRLVPGIEYSCPDNDVHILTWGLDRYLGEHRPVIETLREVRAHGGVAILAHPIRRAAYRKFDPAWIPFLSGIELWNRKSDGLTHGREALRLIAATGLPATVGCDFHRLRHLYPLSTRFEIEGDAATEPALVAALAGGHHRSFALGREVLAADGHVATATHNRLEAARRGLLRLLRT